MSTVLKSVSSLTRHSIPLTKPFIGKPLNISSLSYQYCKVSGFALRSFSTEPSKRSIQAEGDVAGRDLNKTGKGDIAGGSINKNRSWNWKWGDRAGRDMIKIGGGAIGGALLTLAAAYYCNNHPEAEFCDKMQLLLGGKKK